MTGLSTLIWIAKPGPLPFIACCELPLDKATAAATKAKWSADFHSFFFLARELGSVFDPFSQLEERVSKRSKAVYKHINIDHSIPSPKLPRKRMPHPACPV